MEVMPNVLSLVQKYRTNPKKSLTIFFGLIRHLGLDDMQMLYAFAATNHGKNEKRPEGEANIKARKRKQQECKD